MLFFERKKNVICTHISVGKNGAICKD